MQKALTILPLIGIVIGIPLLIGGVYCIRFVWRRPAVASVKQKLITRWACAIMGCVIAGPVMSFNYFTDARTHVFGFPFFSYVFQKRESVWLDFVGPLTIPAIVANAFVGFSLPFIAAAALVYLGRFRSQPNPQISR